MNDDALLDVNGCVIHRVRSALSPVTRCGLVLHAPYARGTTQHFLAVTIQEGSSVNLCRACYPELAYHRSDA